MQMDGNHWPASDQDRVQLHHQVKRTKKCIIDCSDEGFQNCVVKRDETKEETYMENRPVESNVTSSNLLLHVLVFLPI